jgi:hypothetical protein
MHMCIRDVCTAVDLCKLVNGTTVTPIGVTAHSIHFPLPYLIHVFIRFLFVFSRQY